MSVFISNLDDFIAPSQACVNPLVNGSKKNDDKDTEKRKISGKRAVIALENDYSISEFTSSIDTDIQNSSKKPDLIKGVFTEGKVGSETKTVATVSLNDCLACR